MSLYDPIANWYADSLNSGSPVHAVALPSLLELTGDVTGLAVADLACGNGVAARRFARCGARVVGIDLSEPMIELARAEELREPLGISYVVADIQRMPKVETARFDGAVSCLALMDVAELDLCLSEFARIVRPGGWLVLLITHPCFQGPESRWTGKAGGTVKREVRGYFREGFWRSDNAHGVRGQVGAYHRTLSTYINSLVSAGWTIEAAAEPQPTNDIAARVPGYAEVPVALAFRCRRSS